MLVETLEVYGNFSGSDVNGFSIAARELARKVAGVTINPNPEASGRKILMGSFDLLVAPKAWPLIDRVMHSSEVKFLYDVGAYPYPGPHNIGSLCESEEEQNFPLIPDAAKRIEVAGLRRKSLLAQMEADSVFKHDPVKGIRYDVEAIFANGTAQWLSQYLLPPEDIVDQVIDREMALLEAA